MKIHVTNALVIACVAAAGLLSGCAGGDSAASSFVLGTDIPLSATTSSAGASSFVAGVAAGGGNDTAEPLVVGNAELTISETDEPDTSV